MHFITYAHHQPEMIDLNQSRPRVHEHQAGVHRQPKRCVRSWNVGHCMGNIVTFSSTPDIPKPHRKKYQESVIGCFVVQVKQELGSHPNNQWTLL